MKYLKTSAISLFIATSLLTATAAFADVNSDQLRGVVLVKSGNYREAIPFLRKAVESDPSNPEANYYLGLALNRTGAGKEAESFLKHSLLENPENPGLNFELGTHYYNKDVHAEAADYFEQVIQIAPGSQLAVDAAEFLKKMDEKKQPKSWELSIFAGGQYDSNVMLNGRGMPLPAGFTGKSDWSALAYFKGIISPIKNDEAGLDLGYSVYQNLHASLKDFDITQNLLEISGINHINSAVSIKGAYSFEHLMLNGRRYDIANSVNPSIILKSSLGTTTLDYRARITRYSNSDKFPDNADRNGSNHLAGVNHLLPLTDSTAVWALYAHDVELTKRLAWNYDGDHLLLGLRTVLPLDVVVDLSGDIYRKDYRGFDTLYGTTRQDSQYTLSVSLVKNFSERFSLSLSESLSRNNSNIPEFEYDRSITSLLFNAKF